jgi:hypothetical protein
MILICSLQFKRDSKLGVAHTAAHKYGLLPDCTSLGARKLLLESVLQVVVHRYCEHRLLVMPRSTGEFVSHVRADGEPIAVKKERYDFVLVGTPLVIILPSLGKGKMIAEENRVVEYPSNVVLNSGVGPRDTLALDRRKAASKIATAKCLLLDRVDMIES